MTECHRCERPIRKGYPLDTADGMDSWVCANCLKDTDEVVQV